MWEQKRCWPDMQIDKTMSTIATLVVLAAAVLVPCLISELLNHPKLRWVLGKS